MKRLILTLMTAAILPTLVTSCGKKEPEKVEQVQAEAWKKEFANAPQWVLNPQVEGALAAVGSAKIGPAGMQFARTEALANARDEIARMLQIKVKNMIKNFTQVTGIGDQQTVDKVSAQVSKQVASQVLTGSQQREMWISPSGELYVLVVLDPGAVKEAVKQATISSFKNERALWQQFQAKKAYEELEREIQKLESQ
ncbi:LPP20 family lipoprotein [Persephonella sp.]